MMVSVLDHGEHFQYMHGDVLNTHMYLELAILIVLT